MSVVVESVSKFFGAQKAVNNISFSASKGQILGFLGPNGAGKSTTMKMITGYLPVSEGNIKVCDLDVNEHPIECASKIGYLPEHNPLYKDMYIKEYLEFIAGIHQIKEPGKKVKEMIHLTGLTIEQNKKINQLSKGYRQRVGLAQAMIHDPEILILDEPTSGLDPNQLKEIRSLIKELGKEKTVIFSTHIMQEVQAICDRVIIINQGEIVADDPIEKLKDRISGDKIISVSFEQNIPLEIIKKIPGVKSAAKKGNHVYEIKTGVNDDIRQKLFNLAVETQNTILELKQESLSVEQIFQELTSKKPKS
jgi:ABC-2 type transport system ATP-binding protein